MKVGNAKIDDVETKEKEKSPEISKPMLTDTEKGLISLGIVSGAAYAIHSKRSVLGVLGFMWLGYVAGRGFGYLLKKKEEIK